MLQDPTYIIITTFLNITMLLMFPDSSLISSYMPSFSLILVLSSGIRPSSAPSAITTTQWPLILALSIIAS